MFPILTGTVAGLLDDWSPTAGQSPKAQYLSVKTPKLSDPWTQSNIETWESLRLGIPFQQNVSFREYPASV